MAELDITEPFEPQEGSLELPSELIDYDVRMTVTPVAGGDAVALRILHRDQILRPLDSLGLCQRKGEAVRKGTQLQRGTRTRDGAERSWENDHTIFSRPCT